MSLRISDDRLCQDCDDLNRAACEGRACAEQSGDDTETQSAPAASATSTTSTGTTSATSSSKSIRNELLCYVANKMDLVVHDSLISCVLTFTIQKLSNALSKSCSTVLLLLSAVLDTRDDKVQARTRTTWRIFLLSSTDVLTSLNLWQVICPVCRPLT